MGEVFADYLPSCAVRKNSDVKNSDQKFLMSL